MPCKDYIAPPMRYYEQTDMDEFLKMDIFFVVTTISVVVMTVLASLVLTRVLRILKNVEDISAMIEDEGKKIREDIAQVRENINEEGIRLKHLMKFIGIGKRARQRAKTTAKKS